MADQNKLTVAELLARNNKARGEKESKKDNRSRRHRRSLDEGGISVAELTGNLKKVKASPAEAKHTSVSIDEDAPVIRSPKSAEQAGACLLYTSPSPRDRKAHHKARSCFVRYSGCRCSGRTKACCHRRGSGCGEEEPAFSR